MLLLPDGFTPGFAGPEYLTEPAWWFIYAGDRLLTHLDEQHARIPFGLEPPPLSGDPLRRLYMGCYAGNHCYALEVPADTLPPPGLGFKGLRSLWGTLAEDAIGLAGQALQLVDWDRCHQFCGRCGQTTVLRDNERSKHRRSSRRRDKTDNKQTDQGKHAKEEGSAAHRTDEHSQSKNRTRGNRRRSR